MTNSKEYMRKYRLAHKDAYKEYYKKYDASPKGRKRRAKYEATEKGILNEQRKQKKYRSSPKVQECIRWYNRSWLRKKRIQAAAW